MTPLRTIVTFVMFVVLAGCAEEPPPRTVDEFLDNPIMLEAAMVRCSANRRESRYDAECINAREAVNRIEAREEAKRRKELEAQSARKRDALRRTQAAAAEARRRAAEARRREEEAAYLAQFGELPPGAELREQGGQTGNVPLAVIPDSNTPSPQPADDATPEVVFDEVVREDVPVQPASDGGNAPAAQQAPSDLSDIRDELRRRNEQSGD